MRRLITRHPDRYEDLKRRVRRVLPLPDKAIRRASGIVSRVHQRYFEDFVFIHINKCGGTSIERALGIPLLTHDTARMRRATIGERRWAERFKFSVVRDPYDRAASLFFQRRRNATFDMADAPGLFVEWLEAVRDRHRRGVSDHFEQAQMEWIVDDSGEIALDYVCRLERLDHDLEYVATRLGRPIRAARLNRNPRPVAYASLYTPAARQIVHELWGDDFTRLGYARVAAGDPQAPEGAG